MHSILLVLAEVTGPAAGAAAAHGEAAGGLWQITQDFGISLPGILAQILSFSIGAWVLWKFAFKPVLATLDERQRQIESGLTYAKEMEAKLAAAQQESTALVKQAQIEATRVIDEARKAAKDHLDRQTHEATAKTTDLFAKAQQAIELEHKKMLAGARTEIARLVVTTTERVLAQQLSDADRAAYNAAASRELADIKG
jgi:F-type H+-transporting ATPase subunit b